MSQENVEATPRSPATSPTPRARRLRGPLLLVGVGLRPTSSPSSPLWQTKVRVDLLDSTPRRLRFLPRRGPGRRTSGRPGPGTPRPQPGGGHSISPHTSTHSLDRPRGRCSVPRSSSAGHGAHIDVGVEQSPAAAWRSPAVVRLEAPRVDLHVLLRHRPRSISRLGVTDRLSLGCRRSYEGAWLLRLLLRARHLGRRRAGCFCGGSVPASRPVRRGGGPEPVVNSYESPLQRAGDPPRLCSPHPRRSARWSPNSAAGLFQRCAVPCRGRFRDEVLSGPDVFLVVVRARPAWSSPAHTSGATLAAP